MTMADRARRFVENGMALHRRQPLVAAAALLLAGIVCGYRFGAWPLGAGVALACAAALGWAARAGLRAALAALLTVALGWGLAAWDRDGRGEEARQFRALPPKPVFVCRVGPEVAVTPLRGRSAKYTFRAERFRCEAGAFACRQLPVEVSWFGARPGEGGASPQPGEVWRLSGSGKVRKGRNGLLMLSVNTGEGRSRRLAATEAGSWTARVERARRLAAARVTIGIESWGEIPALNQAMLLGSRHAMSAAMRRVFVDSGTIHVFAISGLHIVLVASVLVLAVASLGVPRTYWIVFVAPLLIFYTVTTGARPSAVRACLMAVLYFAAPLIGRKPSGIAALAGAAVLVHALHPWLIYDIGCVLSFVVMGGLVVFCRPFCMIARRACGLGRMETQARLLDAAGEQGRARRLRWLKGAAQFLADSLAVSLAAWLASVPLTAYYFGRFTPGGLFANLVIGPCSFFIVVAGCLGMAASLVSEWAAACFNHAAGFFTLVMVRTAEVTAACPGGNFRIAKWAPWMVWTWFGVLVGVAGWLRARRPDGLAWLNEGVGQREDLQ